MHTWQVICVGLVSLTVALLVVLSRRWHARWTGDFANSGVQKLHLGAPPRVGIVPLICGVGLGVFVLQKSGALQAGTTADTLMLAVLASLPVVLLGLADDVTKVVPPWVRLVGAIAAGTLAVVLLGNTITRTDVPLLDSLLAVAPFSVLPTLLMVGGFTNAMNIVDGLNGLAAGLALLMIVATAIVAASMGDLMIVNMCIVLGASITGFLLVNFPRGRLFLGDGGAYFIGFLLVQIWILLVNRNPSVTPWFVVAVAFHPTMECVFSIVRRRLYPGRNGAAMAADRLHLHSLVYRRRATSLFCLVPGADRWGPNATASLMVITIGTLPMALAVMRPTSATWNLGVIAFAIVTYLTWFNRLVRFRVSHLVQPVAQVALGRRLGRDRRVAAGRHATVASERRISTADRRVASCVAPQAPGVKPLADHAHVALESHKVVASPLVEGQSRMTNVTDFASSGARTNNSSPRDHEIGPATERGEPELAVSR